MGKEQSLEVMGEKSRGSEGEELMLLRITGEDRPGLTASIMDILSRHDVDIQDIGQADIHSTLSLGILIKVRDDRSGYVMKELLFKANELGVNIGFAPVTMEEYEAWVARQGKNRYILTVLGRRLKARQIEAVSRLIAEQGLNIDGIKRLSGRASILHPKEKTRACIQFSVRGTPKDREALHGALLQMSGEMEIDGSFQTDNMYRRMRRLICFDMDSTLIQTEVIDELARRNGVYEQVAAITERAMRGGYKIAILSGGFTFFGEYIQKKYGIDYVYANELEIDETGHLTGNYVGEIVDGKRKAELLKLIAQVEKVDLQQTIAVGDGANDLPMLSQAGLGIAFHAKPRVVANAQQSINTIGLDGVLYFLGFKDSYLDEKAQ